MPPAESRQVQFISKLHGRTQEGRLEWTKESDNTFQTHLAGFVVQIAAYPSEDSETIDYWVFVESPDGTRLDSIVDTEFAEIRNDFNAFRLMRETYERARRLSLGADQALDDILKALDADDIGE